MTRASILALVALTACGGGGGGGGSNTPADANTTTSDPGGPEFLSFGTNVTTLKQTTTANPMPTTPSRSSRS